MIHTSAARTVKVKTNKIGAANNINKISEATSARSTTIELQLGINNSVVDFVLLC